VATVQPEANATYDDGIFALHSVKLDLNAAKELRFASQ
jgi:hypothetical protein